jgi:cobalt-zinc-cadmium efflux system membrane fusion protein
VARLLIVLAVVTLAFAGCEGSKSDAPANNYGAKDPNHPELFTLRPEQMSHVQVVTVQPTTLTRTLRLTGAVAYNGFRTTPVITQVSGPVSRVVVVPSEKVHQGQPPCCTWPAPIIPSCAPTT